MPFCLLGFTLNFLSFRFAIFYEGAEPLLFVRDLDMIKKVLITDFDHFMNSTFGPDYVATMDCNYLGMAFTRGDEWKSIRSQVYSAFSLKNLKAITMDFQHCANKVLDHMETFAENGDPIHFDKITGFFTMDCIGKAVYSMDLNSCENPKSELMEKASHFFNILAFLLMMTFPWVCWVFNMSMWNRKTTGKYD